MELNWNDHKDQLTRQVLWQQVRHDFYGNMCHEARNQAAHERAYGGEREYNPDSRAEQRDRRIAERASECRSASEFYNRVVIPQDQAIKAAVRAGDADLHIRLLDEANEIIQQMYQHTNLAICHDKI